MGLAPERGKMCTNLAAASFLPECPVDPSILGQAESLAIGLRRPRPSSLIRRPGRIEFPFTETIVQIHYAPRIVPISDTAISTERSAERSLELALAAARTAADHRGQEIVVLDMRPLTPEFDYFVLVSGNSRRQLHAIGDEIDHTLQDELGDRRLGIEGYSESRWILLDYGSVVIHLFDIETRRYYALEELWGTAKRVELPWEKEPGRAVGRVDDSEQ
jgi:ribosome-associated protein